MAAIEFTMSPPFGASPTTWEATTTVAFQVSLCTFGVIPTLLADPRGVQSEEADRGQGLTLLTPRI